MSELLAQPWFWPTAAVIVGLPAVLLVLTEVHAALVRRDNPAARIVLLVRNWVVPFGALLLLLAQVRLVTGDVDWVKVTATVFGFLVILVILNGLNLAVFVTARSGSWRQRLPKIFIDITRLVVILISLAVVFAVVWGADIGGLFTALGIGSIVIGLALQNAVGPLISGLLLLFEQPFQLGDWLRTPEGKGKVVEVNWRAIHLDTNNGLRIVPNSQLASGSFVNLTRATNPYEASLVVRFATDDPPEQVIALLIRVASEIPQCHPDAGPSAIPLEKARYEVGIPLVHPGAEWGAGGLFRRRLWYAARRAGLHLDRDLTDPATSPELAGRALAKIAPLLHLGEDEADIFAHRVRLERYGDGEIVQRPQEVPDGVRYIVEGRAEMTATDSEGRVIRVTEFTVDDPIGLTSLTRQGIASAVVATTDLTVLLLPVELLDEIVETRRALARDYGREIDNRRQLTFEAFVAAGLEPPSGSRLIAY